MTTTRKCLGQSNPSATTLTALYTVPAATTAIVTTLNITNRSATGTTFRISHALAGAADNDKQYLYYDAAIGGNDCVQVTTAMPMATTDVLRVYAGAATLSFSVYGEELS